MIIPVKASLFDFYNPNPELPLTLTSTQLPMDFLTILFSNQPGYAVSQDENGDSMLPTSGNGPDGCDKTCVIA